MSLQCHITVKSTKSLYEKTQGQESKMVIRDHLEKEPKKIQIPIW